MKNKKWIISLAVIPIGIAAYLLSRPVQNTGTQYKTIRVERGNLSLSVLTTGTVEPENRLNIQAPIAGRAEQILVDQGQRVQKGQVLAWVSSTERAALLDGARSEGPEEVKKWEALYKPTPVIAPVAGMIIQRNIQPGQTFATTDAILVMSDHLIIQAQVDETDISQLRLQQRASIVLDAYPDHTIPGKIQKIAYDAKTINNVTTYEVEVLPDDVPASMRSGMTANLTFAVGAREGVLLLPADSIKTKEGRPYVLVSAGDNRQPIRRDVSLGMASGKRVEIVSGVSEGDLVLEPEYKATPPKMTASSPFGPGVGRGGKH